MAGCEYQIEGSDKIYSESEFKKLLSEGYLDKVMMDKGIKIKGIKADEALASSFQIPSAIQPQAPTEVKSDYQIAQDATNEVSKENPDASVLLTPKGEDLSLTAVYVAKENRGKGIGTKVLESVKKQADKLGKKVVLDATTELDEETDLGRLESFYEKNGFTKVGDNKFEYNPTAEITETVTPEVKEEIGASKKIEELLPKPEKPIDKTKKGIFGKKDRTYKKRLFQYEDDLDDWNKSIKFFNNNPDAVEFYENANEEQKKYILRYSIWKSNSKDLDLNQLSEYRFIQDDGTFLISSKGFTMKINDYENAPKLKDGKLDFDKVKYDVVNPKGEVIYSSSNYDDAVSSLYEENSKYQLQKSKVSIPTETVTKTEEKVTEPTVEEQDNVAKKSGITPKNFRDLYKVNRELFGLDRVKSFTNAIAMDRMIGTMARRAGVDKSEMYGRLQFEKDTEENVLKAENALFQGVVNGENVNLKNVDVEVVNGFYSNTEKALSQVKQEKMSGNQWATQLLSRGANKEEMYWTGLQDYLKENASNSISKSDINQFLKDNRINVVEIVKGTGEKLDETQYALYQLEGESENYKEILVTIPKKEERIPVSSIREEVNYERKGYYIETDANGKSFAVRKPKTKFKSSHFNEPDILVHLRMNTRIDSDGKKVLFIEEVQSDWGQEGKRKGFINKEIKEKRKELESNLQKVKDEVKKIENEIDNLKPLTRNEIADLDQKKKKLKEAQMNVRNNRDWDAIGQEIDKIEEEINSYENKKRILRSKIFTLKHGDGDSVSNLSDKLNEFDRLNPEVGIESAPFVTDTNAWTKLGLKVALKQAVNQGADRIAWTTGEQQNERYDLRKQVDDINYFKNEDGTYRVYAKKDGNIIFKEDSLKENELEGAFGKDVAKKIISDEGQVQEGLAAKKLSGDDLAVGGKGMKGFYGSPKEGSLGIVGNVIKGLTKQEPKITNLSLKDYSEKISQAKEFIKEFKELNDEETAENWQKRLNKLEQKQNNQNIQYSIDITPEIKADVQKGLALFQKEQGKKAKGAMVAADSSFVIYALTDPNVSTPLHELAHVYEHYLTDAERNKILKAAGTDTWNTKTSEYFARGFEKYLSEGKSPVESLNKVFDKFKEWLTDIYSGIKDSEIDIKLNKEMKSIYDSMLKEETTKQPTREAVAAKNMADILRKAKIKMEGGTAMASFLPGFENVWNGSIETVSKAIELGGITAGNFRQSIESGMKALKQTDAYKAITDPKERAKISARYKKILTSAYSEGYGIDTDNLREAEFNDFNQKLEESKDKTLSNKEFNALKAEAKKFVNDNLPADSYRKSEVQSYVRNNFDKVKTVEDIQKNLDKVNSIMTTKEAKIQKETEKQAAKDKKTLIKEIESKIAANSKKVVSKNRRTGAKKGKITIESQQQINQIIQDLKDQGLFKNLDMLSDTELNDLNNTIDNILETGRVEQKQLEAVNDAKKRADKAIIFQALAGDSDDVLNGKEQVQERFKKANGYVIVDKQLMSSSDFKSYINKNPDTDLTDVPFYYKSESIDKVKQRLEKDSGILKAAKDGTLFNIVDLETHIKNLGAKSPELKKWLEDNIGNPIREAKRKEVESLWRETKQYKKDINKIFGTYSVKTKEFYRNKWRTKTVNIPKVYDTLVAPSDITPKNSDESLLAGEVVTLYMIVYNTNPEIKDKYKLDPKEAEKDMKTLMRENYVDPQKIYDFMHKPENKSLLDFAHFLSKKYNEDARAMFGPTIEQFHQIALGNTYYHPKIRSSSTLEPESIMNLEQDKSLSITSPNMRHRTDNASAPFKIISAHELYLNYLKSMTHAKEYIPVVKAAQTLLTDVNKPYIMEKLGSVSDYNDMVKALSIAITDKSPFESGPMSALTNWTALTMLWFRIKSIPQQASSLVHYYTSGIKDGVMPWDILRAVPTTKEEREFSAKFYSDNPYLWTRLSGGNITPEMQKLKEQTDSLSNSLIKGTLSLARFTGLIGIKFGDFAAAATPGGGMSFALAQFKKKFKETGDYQSSRDFAIQRWMEETERTGQVSLAREIMSTQSFNTLVRLFIPFSSAQQGMGKKAYKAYLDIKDSENLTNKEYAQAIADLIYFPLLAPLPFLLTGNAGAALFRMFFDDEEDETLEDAQKKRIYHDLIFDAAQSNATALGLPGLLLNVTMNIARDRAGFNQSPSYQRLTDIGTELVSLLSSNKKWEDLSVSERKQFTKDYISENGSLKGKNIKDIYDDSIVSEKQINLLLKSIGAKNIKDLIESIKKLSKDKDFWAFFLDLETKDDKINKKLDPYFNQAVKNNKKDELYEFLSRLQRYFEDEDYKIEEYIPKEGIKTKSKRTSKFSSPKIQKPKISRPKMPKF